MKATQARKGKLLLLWNATKVSIYFVWRFQSSFRRGEAQEQYDQIGIVQFLKFMDTHFFTLVTQIYFARLGYCEKHRF